ncbi:hypothetical protein TRFO_08555 [Tritrichomonas foetus]|uniref:Uncharacterized protein n=1 Tax=Tritrichomonas foetus TaxID=1144522 RepID=A0A1J4JND0_9EUKA|nr:hypothetical protein TRFO_08555 [Tritrichomonas foetus]|eukprot:OHS99013.1 hypothetical protein TRFO_08555 [Tritrichomonas foetus]
MIIPKGEDENETTLIFTGEGSNNFYIKPLSDLILKINSTDSEFGILVTEESTPTIILDQTSIKMNLKGSGSLIINTTSRIGDEGVTEGKPENISLGTATISENEEITLQIPQHLNDRIIVTNANLYGISKLNIQLIVNKKEVKQQRNIKEEIESTPFISIKEINLGKGSKPTINNLKILDNLYISEGSQIEFKDVHFANANLTVLIDLFYEHVCSIISDELFNSPAHIMIQLIESSSKLLETLPVEQEILYPISSSNKFEQCEQWKQSLIFEEQTQFKSSKCVEANLMTTLYLSTLPEEDINSISQDESFQTNDPDEDNEGNEDNGLSGSAIAGIVIGCIAAVVIIIVIV